MRASDEGALAIRYHIPIAAFALDGMDDAHRRSQGEIEGELQLGFRALRRPPQYARRRERTGLGVLSLNPRTPPRFHYVR